MWSGGGQQGQGWSVRGENQADWPSRSKAIDPDELRQHGARLQVAAREPGTRESYRHWWRLFAEFCVEVGWAVRREEVPVPVAASVVVMWVAWLSDEYANSTIAVSLAAISAIHGEEGAVSPTTDARVKAALEGAARTGKVRGTLEQVVVTPEHLRLFTRVGATGVHPEGKEPWSRLRVQRALAMVVLGFMAFLRKGEVGRLDRCDVSRTKNATLVRVSRAKNDAVGRGRQTVVGAAMGDARHLEASIWHWIRAAGLEVATACTKTADPRARCLECGPLFPRLGGSSPVRVSKKPMGKGVLTEELRELFRECRRRSWLPSNFDEKRFSAIALRRGGNTAACAAGISAVMRAAHGRWKAVETPDQSYTFLHREDMVAMATTMLQGTATGSSSAGRPSTARTHRPARKAEPSR